MSHLKVTLAAQRLAKLTLEVSIATEFPRFLSPRVQTGVSSEQTQALPRDRRDWQNNSGNGNELK